METILENYQSHLASLTLKPSDGGVFDVTVDGKVVFSGLEIGRFPSEEELTKLVGDQLGV